MRKLIYVFVVTILTIYSLKSFGQRKKILPKKVVFHQTSIIDSTGSTIMKSMIDSMANNLGKDENNDSVTVIMKDLFKEMASQLYNQKSSLKEIVLEVSKDTIWRSTILNGQMIGNYERIDTSGTIHYHSKFNRQLEDRTYNLFKNIKKGEITINKNDTKQILGFNCYKIIISTKEEIDEEFPFDMGDKVHEMYVTDLIKLPPHSIVYINKYYSFFLWKLKYIIRKYQE